MGVGLDDGAPFRAHQGLLNTSVNLTVMNDLLWATFMRDLDSGSTTLSISILHKMQAMKKPHLSNTQWYLFFHLPPVNFQNSWKNMNVLSIVHQLGVVVLYSW